jgi:hypothetical protein
MGKFIERLKKAKDDISKYIKNKKNRDSTVKWFNGEIERSNNDDEKMYKIIFDLMDRETKRCDNNSSGFKALKEEGLLNLSIENVILENEWIINFKNMDGGDKMIKDVISRLEKNGFKNHNLNIYINFFYNNYIFGQVLNKFLL